MAITANDVKNLREATNAGMMDCKKALTETNGDFEAAVALLREKGLAVAAKRESKSASEGVLVIYETNNPKITVLSELNCETSFVAKNEQFLELANNIAIAAANSDAADMDTLKNEKVNGRSIAEAITDIMAVIGEKIDAPRFVKYTGTENDTIDGYIHSDKLKGVLIKLTCDNPEVANCECTSKLAKDIAMHIAWSNPTYLNVEDVPAEEVEKETEIQINRAKEEGKPLEIAKKMVAGRLQKEFFSNICLIKQPYVKDDKMTVGELVENYGKEKSTNIKIAEFVRFRVGEKS